MQIFDIHGFGGCSSTAATLLYDILQTNLCVFPVLQPTVCLGKMAAKTSNIVCFPGQPTATLKELIPQIVKYRMHHLMWHQFDPPNQKTTG